MSKGIAAFVAVLGLVMTLSVLSGIGFYGALGVDYTDSADDDVQAAEDALVGQTADDRSGGSVLQDFTTSAGSTLATGWQVIANLSGILQLLFPIPELLADTLQTFFQVIFGITFAGFIRGVVF